MAASSRAAARLSSGHSTLHIYRRREVQRLEEGEERKDEARGEEGMHSPDETRMTWPPAPEPKLETLAMGGGSRVGFGGRKHRI